VTDYEARIQPEVYRPLIDEALVRIAERSGGDVPAVRRTLERIGPETPSTQWSYLTRALRDIREHLLTEPVKEVGKHNWFLYFLEGRDADYHGHSLIDPDEDAPESPDGDESASGRPVAYLEYYEEEAWECLRQRAFVGGYDADVVALWTREDGRVSVCHAHPEGFWILGEDAAEFAMKFADKLQR
jgi:hypothetical protein